MGCGTSSVRHASLPQKRTIAEIMFHKYDVSNNGKISRKEFQSMCRAMGYNLTKEELDLDMKLLDLDGDGQITFTEFQVWWQKGNKFQNLTWRGERLTLIEELTEQFKEYDTDGSGFLERNEFSKLHKLLLEKKLTTKSLEQCLKELDTTHDGKIAFAEYARFMLNT